ncbi:MAG: hypothetical protein CMH24_01590 [Nitrosomonadales bacterium]|nr:hypothetical protein [Nitrosomonadales bacterium]|tara:strand:+ start:314 stop:1081 length:768 start_codon:yes stop_codon:yes gene_type:complete
MHIKIIGKGKPVVLIHGWGMSGRIWEDLSETMRINYKLFIIDLPGMGKSPLLKIYKINNVIKEIRKHIPSKVIMIGWSLGGQIAMKYALQYPGSIKNLICVSSTPSFICNSGWDFGMDKKIFLGFKKELKDNWKKTLKNFFLLQLIKNKEQKNILKRFEKHYINEKPGLKLGLEKSLNILEDNDLRNDIKKIQIPTLIITGKKDNICSYKASIWLHSEIKDSKLFIFESEGHIPFINNKKKFFQIIHQFIKINES